MARLRNEGNSSTLFQFGGKEKILLNGSLAPKFKCNIQRNKRINAIDLLHKKGIDNLEFAFTVILSGTDRFTNLATLSGLAEAQTTIYLDTEGIHDTYNGKYEFYGDFNPEIDEDMDLITVKFNLIEQDN